MKIAYLYPHWRIQVPPRELSYALDIVADGLVSHLPKSIEPVLYLRGTWRRNRTVVHGSTTYRRLPVRVDRVVARLLALLWQLRRRLGVTNLRRTAAASTAFFLGYGLQAALDIRRRRCDIVHIYIYDQFAPIVRALNPDARIVLHLHDHSEVQRDAAVTRRRLQCCDLVVGCSDFITGGVRTRFPELADRCRTVWNGIDIDRFRDAATTGPRQGGADVRLLFVGRLSPEKGVHVLLRAFNRVHVARPGTTLDLVGPETVAPIEFVDPLHDDPRFADLRRFYLEPGSYRTHLHGLRQEGDARAITFAGTASNSRTADHYRRADIFVFPSVWDEPFGLPVIEAMAAGLPVIATRGGAFPELVVDGETGLLVAPGDVDALADAVARLAADARLRHAMGRAGRRRARALLGWDRVAAQWLDLYGDLMRADRRSARWAIAS